MSKVYIAAQVGWDYDDNNYYRTDGNHPTKAFRDRKKAEQFVLEKNISSFKGEWGSIREYGGYDLNNLLNFDSNKRKMKSIFKKLFELSPEDWLNDYSVDFVVKPTEEDWSNLYNLFNVEFYELTEVEIDE